MSDSLFLMHTYLPDSEEGNGMRAQLRRRTFQPENASINRIQLRRSRLHRRTQAECGVNYGEASVHGRRALSANNEGGASMRHLLHCSAIVFRFNLFARTCSVKNYSSTAAASKTCSSEMASFTQTEIDPALTGKRPLPSSPISTLSSRLPV